MATVNFIKNTTQSATAMSRTLRYVIHRRVSLVS